MIMEIACNYLSIWGLALIYRDDGKKVREIRLIKSWTIIEDEEHVSTLLSILVPIKRETYNSRNKFIEFEGRRLLFYISSYLKPYLLSRESIRIKDKIELIGRYISGTNPYEGIEKVELYPSDLLFECKIQRLFNHDFGYNNFYKEVLCRIERFATDRKVRLKQYKRKLIFNRPLYHNIYSIDIAKGLLKSTEPKRGRLKV